MSNFDAEFSRYIYMVKQITFTWKLRARPGFHLAMSPPRGRSASAYLPGLTVVNLQDLSWFFDLMYTYVYIYDICISIYVYVGCGINQQNPTNIYQQTSLLGGEVARNRKFSPVIAEFYDLWTLLNEVGLWPTCQVGLAAK